MRARRSLDCGAVASAALRADWMAALEGAGRARRSDAAAGFRGLLGLSRRFSILSPDGRTALSIAPALRGPPPSPSENATKWRRRGAEPLSDLVGHGVLPPGGHACPGIHGAWLGPPQGARGKGRRSRNAPGRCGVGVFPTSSVVQRGRAGCGFCGAQPWGSAVDLTRAGVGRDLEVTCWVFPCAKLGT